MITGYDRLPACPICVNLAELGVFGLHGPLTDVRAMCSSIILQAVTLHSPEDLVLVVIEGEPQGTRGVGEVAAAHPLGDVADLGAARRRGRGRRRRHDARAALGRQAAHEHATTALDHRWPWILVILDESANVDAALASQLLDLCPQAGISVVAAVGSDARVPRQAKATMGCVPQLGGTLALSTVWFTDPDVPPEHLELEPANARLIDQVAMSLAPLRDATAASATTAIPRIVPLLSLFGPELPTPLSVAARWSPTQAVRACGSDRDRPGRSARARPRRARPACAHRRHVGRRQERAAAVDRRRADPPVPADAADVPVRRLQGRGGERRCSTTFPHTVGYVTNLEAILSLRALTSLRAELNHRMRLMEGKAKDLAEMLERYPDEAPPSLVIVVDEFATLVKEVPDFVAGIVDIAQRGRSLGVHLILATQRPSGSVNENILANTNLRISLRMLDEHGVQDDHRRRLGGRHPAAAEGPRLRQARPARPHRVPVGVHRRAAHRRRTRSIPVIVERVRQHGPARRPDDDRLAAAPRHARPPATTVGDDAGPHGSPTPTAVAPTALRTAGRPADATAAVGSPQPPAPPVPSLRHRPRAVPASRLPPPTPAGARHRRAETNRRRTSTCSSTPCATAMPNLPPPRKPWREMLPEVLPWARSSGPTTPPRGAARGRFITLGVLDDPAAQAQYPAVFDLEEGGGLLIAGGGGSGKTTALRTVARAAVEAATPDEVALFVIDCASRSLLPLRDLPHCAAVATGDDLESITRVIVMLTAELDRRRALLSHLDVQAETLSVYLDKGHSLPRIVVLVDGYQNLNAILGTVQTDGDRTARLVWPSSIASSPTAASSGSTSSSPPIAARRCRR